jgi:hypothetical protein
MAAAISVGMLFDAFACSITFARLSGVWEQLVYAAALFAGATVVVDVLALRAAWRDRLVRIPLWLPLAVGLVLLGGVAAAGFVAKGPRLGGLPGVLADTVPYFGWPMIVCALAGMVTMMIRESSVGRPTVALVVFLALVSSATLMNQHIAALYPWATRRWLVYTLPLVAVTCGYVVSLDWWRSFGRSRFAPLLRFCLAAVIVMPVAGKVRNAWRTTEYDGAIVVLEEMAKQIAPGDIVVADHFWWGTPLMLVHGKQVLNGERLWRTDGVDSQPDLLQGLLRYGGRIRFLTTTTQGLEVYPFAVGPVVLDWSSGPSAFREIAHHATPGDFKTRVREHEFRLYSWHPDVP